ncbi:MAG: hypothetical protein M3115_06895 [Thermoproteota archaeon]|nr:hypothetical protein [Thermoproteota archaeon]
MQKEEAEESSSTTMMDPWSIFLYGMKAPMSREKYRGRLARFFDFIGLTEGTMEERAKAFTERSIYGSYRNNGCARSFYRMLLL